MSRRLIATCVAVAVAASGCASHPKPAPPTPPAPAVDSGRPSIAQAPRDTTRAPSPPPPLAPAVAPPAAPPPVPTPHVAPAPATKVAPPPPKMNPLMPPRPRHGRGRRSLTARELAARDSAARAVALRDSLARDVAVRDSLALAARRDSLVAIAWLRDSLVREQMYRDSLSRVAARRDSVARAVAVRDSLAHAAADDSLYGPEGAMPRIEGDPNIVQPTVGAEFIFVQQVYDTYQQVQFSYGHPFLKNKNASWEIDIPIQHWDSVAGGKSATSFANATLLGNLRLSNGTWRQIVSLALSPQSQWVNESIGNDQWTIQPSYALSHWFASDRLHLRTIVSWTYGWWVDPTNGTKRKNVIIPRVVLSGRVNDKINATLDLRPRIDITRNEFYSTLMILASRPLPWQLGLQAGYEFPLDSLAKKHVEKSKVYVNVSRTF